jgi:hypothetical protein
MKAKDDPRDIDFLDLFIKSIYKVDDKNFDTFEVLLKKNTSSWKITRFIMQQFTIREPRVSVRSSGDI